MQQSTYRGTWWLPASPDDIQHGALTINIENEATLELVGGFAAQQLGPPDEDGRQPVYWNGRFSLVHGLTARGKPVTLVGVNVTSSSGFPLSSVADQILSADAVVIGTLMHSSDEALFTGVDIELDDLIFWANRSGLQAQIQVDQRNRIEHATGSAVPVEALCATWEGYRFELRFNLGLFDVRQDAANSREVAARESVTLRIEHDDLQSATTYLELATTFRDLLTLAMDRPCAVRSMTYQLPRADESDDPVVPTAEAFYRFIYPADSKPFAAADDSYLFVLDDSRVSFEQVVPRWYDLATRQISTALRLLLSIDYAGDGYVSAQLMTQCSALESLHRGLGDRPKNDPEEFASFIQQLTDAVDSNWHDTVRGSLRNDLSFAMRLRDLLDRADADAIRSLLSDETKWITQAKKGRNALAHATDHRDSMPFEMQYRLLMVSRAFSRLVVANELGVPGAEQQRYATNRQLRFHAYRFGQMLGLIPSGPQRMGMFVIGNPLSVGEVSPLTQHTDPLSMDEQVATEGSRVNSPIPSPSDPG